MRATAVFSLLVLALAASPAPAFARNQTDLPDGSQCERVETNGSSTFGRCETVCRGKEVTRDAANNRWVCRATAVRTLQVARPQSQNQSRPATATTP